jgi:hypothetical protein
MALSLLTDSTAVIRLNHQTNQIQGGYKEVL